MKLSKRSVVIILLLAAILVPPIIFINFHDPIVLMYHFVRTKEEAKVNSLVISKETLTKHLHWLKSWGYRVYSLDELDDIKTGRKKFDLMKKHHCI